MFSLHYVIYVSLQKEAEDSDESKNEADEGQCERVSKVVSSDYLLSIKVRYNISQFAINMCSISFPFAIRVSTKLHYIASIVSLNK